MSKSANVIIVGGTIAAGKSTLVDMLSTHLNWPAVSELREGDKLQEIVLQKLYQGNRIHLATVQYYFITHRYAQYQDIYNNGATSILDRGIWEDWFFAKLLMKNEMKSYQHYTKLWRSTIMQIIENFGLPKAYIFVKVDWETFKQRIYNRSRLAEINNFAQNEQYFADLLNEYNTAFVALLREWGIEPIVIDSSSLSKEQMFTVALEELKKRKLA